MTKKVKIGLGIIALVAVTTVAVVATTSSQLLQGKLSKASGCNIVLENFDPNPGVVAKYGDAIDFKWNGPGCSTYKWSQYLLCFENVNNTREFACIGIPGVPYSNHKTLSVGDWEFINGEMETLTSDNRVETRWYVQSRFGDAIKGEIKTTEPWKFTYSTLGAK